jgi:eukaryotic-like serine/threonine-protein kinase
MSLTLEPPTVSQVSTKILRAHSPSIEGYSIGARLGRGGMGEVFCATETATGDVVALKLLDPPQGSDLADFHSRFVREITLLKSIHHPNIIRILASGRSNDGRDYFTTEYLPELDLRKRMATGRAWPAPNVRDLIVRLATGISHLHEHQILHRDLKPENILLRGDGTPVITDFGVAVPQQEIGMLTRTGDAVGSWGYAAPEQQYKLGIDARADQYSLAAIAYELLTGQRALGLFPAPSRLNATLSPQVDRVLLRALNEDPKRRYPSVDAFAGDFVRSLEARPYRWPVRRRNRVALGLLAAAILVGGMIAFLLSGSRESPEPGPTPFAIVEVRPAAVDLPLIRIPAGEFTMGAIPNDANCDRKSEFPSRSVRLTKPFAMGKTEVTVAQFRTFVEATGYRTTAEEVGGGFDWIFDQPQVFLPGLSWKMPREGEPPADDDPVTQVSWVDANAFCEWLSRVEGVVYRLPTEAEWEYCCRAGTTTRFIHGNEVPGLDEYGWYNTNSGERVRPTGRKLPNAFGLHDMHGNVYEWCLDFFDEYDPKATVDPLQTAGKYKVIRGGSFKYLAEASRSSARFTDLPDFRDCSIGFRICQPSP